MKQLNRDNTIYYQQKQHHRQNLRQQIKPQTIEYLEINQHPSAVGRKACRSLYQQQIKKQYNRAESIGHDQARLQSRLLPTISRNRNKSSVLFLASEAKKQQSNIFQDYDKQKYLKANKHIITNIQKGTDFYRASQQHEKLRQKQLQQLAQTLKKQIMQKRKQSQTKKLIKQFQSKSYAQNRLSLKLKIQNQQQRQKKMKQNLFSQYQKQIQQIKIRKQVDNKFVYNNKVRHNPITNPIQYHIDNPYILNQIQQNSQCLGKQF